MMTPEEIERWRRDILQRLDVLKSKALHTRQYFEAKHLDQLEDKEDLAQAWRSVYERFPHDLKPLRGRDLGRHLTALMFHHFAKITRIFCAVILYLLSTRVWELQTKTS